MIPDVVLAHLPCPHCGQAEIALRAEIQTFVDDEGHTDDFTVDELICPKCGLLLDDADSLAVERTARVIEDAIWNNQTILMGEIHAYWPDIKPPEQTSPGEIEFCPTCGTAFGMKEE